jgi:hypothetical protein
LHGPHSSHSLQLLRSDRKRRIANYDSTDDDAETADQLPGEVPPSSESPKSQDCCLPVLPVASPSNNLEIINFPTGDSIQQSSFLDDSELMAPVAPSNIHISGRISKLLGHSNKSTNEVTNTSSKEKRDAVTAGLFASTDAEVRSSQLERPLDQISWRSVYDNPSKRQAHEDTKLQDAIQFIRGQLQSGMATQATLYAKFNYPSCYDVEILKLLAIEFKADISGVLAKKRVGHKEVLSELILKLLQ